MPPMQPIFIASYPAQDGGLRQRDPPIASFIIPLSWSIDYVHHGILLGHDQLLIITSIMPAPSQWESGAHLPLQARYSGFISLKYFESSPPLPSNLLSMTAISMTGFVATPPIQNSLHNLYYTHKVEERGPYSPLFHPTWSKFFCHNSLANIQASPLIAYPRDNAITVLPQQATYTIAMKYKLCLPSIINYTLLSLQCPCRWSHTWHLRSPLFPLQVPCRSQNKPKKHYERHSPLHLLHP